MGTRVGGVATLKFEEGCWWAHGRYVGPIKELQGETALVKRDFTAQFDRIGLEYNGVSLWHHWHQFDFNDFENVRDNGT